jgi:glycosyltransferase involved in cell wall biosynthesis
MVVLHIIDSPSRGGTETLALDLCRNAKNTGLDLILVVTKQGVLDEEFRSSGVEYYYLPRKYPLDIFLIYKLIKIVKKKKVKVIHTHQAVDGIHAYFTRLFTDTKIVMSFHGHVPSFKDDLTLRFLIPRMDANVAVSNTFLKRLGDEIKFDTCRNFHVVYNGIDTKKFFKTDRNLRRELKLSDSDLLLGMIGNFNNNIRDHITVCKALPSIFNKYPHSHFIFVGKKPDECPVYYDECFSFCQENRILNKTHFLGLRKDINDILNSLDLFIYSSNHDTFGIAVIEAMMANLPVIVNDLPLFLEITDGGKFVTTFKSKNSEDLEKKIIYLIENVSQRKFLAQKGKDWAFARYSIENYIIGLKKLYYKIITE